MISFLFVVLTASLSFGQGAPPAAVVTAPVERGNVELNRPLVATVEPVTRTTVAAEEAGMIAERRFNEGQRVPQGELLAKSDTAVLEQEIAAAKAAVESAQAALESAKAVENRSRLELQRIEQLYQTRVAPENEYQLAVADQNSARAQMAVRAAELAQRKADLDRLQVKLNKAAVRAPFEGVIAKRYVEVGQWINQGDPVADLVQLDPLFVRVAVPEEFISRVGVGNKVKVTIDALDGQVVEGVVDQVLPEADPATRTFAVKVRVENKDLKIRPGFFARVSMSSQNEQASFLVPRDALVVTATGSHVVVVRDNKAAVVPVQRGSAMGDKVAVSGELQESDQVVVRGNEMLRGGEDLMIGNDNGGQARR